MANVLFESMNGRQQKFVSSVVARQTPENRELLETIVKAYVITEGIGSMARRVRRKAAVAGKRLSNAIADEPKPVSLPTQKPVTPSYDYAELSKARMFEDDSWEADYAKFLENCEAIKYFLEKFGSYELNMLANTPAFKEAMAVGNALDHTRTNPLKKMKGKYKAMRECLDSLANRENRALLEGIYVDLYESTVVEVPLHPIFEAKDAETTEMFREAMAGVAKFIRRHGSYPWTEWLKENHLTVPGTPGAAPKP